MRKLKIIYLQCILITLGLYFYFTSTSSAQIYNFKEVKEILLSNRAQGGDIEKRYDCFRSIDDLIIGRYPPLNPHTKNLYTSMLDKAFLEIQAEEVTQGATIWQIYNHGFVVKTASITIGFDLAEYFYTYKLPQFADLIDIYFISHAHGDHLNERLMDAMTALNKPVVGPAEVDFMTIGMAAGESQEILNLQVTAHDGYHSVPLRQFEVLTQEGFKILHTGDNTFLADIPALENLDIMLFNCWGSGYGIIGIKDVINKAKPKVLLPAHMMELGHLGTSSPPIPYRDVIPAAGDEFNAEYHILGWGERYHYDDSSNDTIPPHSVSELNYQKSDEEWVFTWDDPPPAADGDTASFYRVIIDNYIEYFRTTEQYKTNTEINSMKIYSYDECGNQSTNCAEFDLSVSDVSLDEIEFSPNSPASLVFEELVNISFEYDFSGAGEILVLTIPYTNGFQTPNSSYSNSPFYLNAPDTGSAYFTVHSGDVTVDQVRFQVFDKEMLKSYLDFFLPVNYTFSGSAVESENLLTNGDFSNGDSSWWLFVHSSASATGTIENGEYAVSITNGSDVNWHIQLLQTGLLIEQNKKYSISFEAYAASPRQIGFYVRKDSAPNTIYSGNYKMYSLTTEKQTYTHTFTMNEPTDSTAAFSFDLGNSNVDVYFDNISLIENPDTTSLENDYTDPRNIPAEFELLKNYPNPFNPVTTIRYNVPKTCFVTLKINDLMGREVITLVYEKKTPGTYSVQWNGKDLTSGIYLCCLRAGDFIETKKLMLLK